MTRLSEYFPLILDTLISTLTPSIKVDKIRMKKKLKNKLILLNKKLTRNFRNYGFSVCFKKSIFYLIRPIYEKNIVVLFKTHIKTIEGKELFHNDIDYRVVEPKDSFTIQQIEEMEEWLFGKLLSSIGDKKLCIAALKSEKVIGFYLICLTEIYLASLYLKVLVKKNDEAFGEQITVHHKYRREGIASKLRFMAYRELSKRGIKTIYSTALIDNYASLKLIEKRGGIQVGNLVYNSVLQSKQLRLIRNSGQKEFKETKFGSKLKSKSDENYYFLTDTSKFSS